MESKKCGLASNQRSGNWSWLAFCLELPLMRLRHFRQQLRASTVKKQCEPTIVVRKKFKVERRRYERALSE